MPLHFFANTAELERFGQVTLGAYWASLSIRENAAAKLANITQAELSGDLVERMLGHHRRAHSVNPEVNNAVVEAEADELWPEFRATVDSEA